MKRYCFKTQSQRYFLLYIIFVLFVVYDFTFYTYISHLSKLLSSILSLHGFRGARTAFSESALMRDIVLFDMPVSLLAPFDNGANSTSITASSRTFKITCAVTRILYRVCDSNLSGLRSKSLRIRHLYSQENYVQ